MVLNKTNLIGQAQTNGEPVAENISRSTNDVSQDVYGVGILVLILNSIILVIAIVGNSLMFCITMRKDNRKRSFMLYLAALSISDTVTCFIWVPPYIEDMIPGFSWGSPDVYCKLTGLIFSSAKCISSWLIVAISLERTVSTKLPHQVARISSQAFGIKTISIIVLICFLLNSHILYGYIGVTNGSTTSCTFTSATYETMLMYLGPITNALFYSLVPGTFIILCNTVMVKAVFASVRVRGAISNQTAKKNRELMIVAVTISISFIIFTGPFSLYMLFSGVSHASEVTESDWTLYYLTNVMTYINHASNIFLYVLSGSRFRQQLKELVLCKACRRNQ